MEDSKDKKGGDKSEFSVEPAALPTQPADSYEGTEIGVNIKFEPSNLGEVNGIL